MKNNIELFKKYIINSTENQHTEFSNVSNFWKKQHTSFGFKNKFDYIPTPQEIQNLRSWKKRSGMGNGYQNRQIEWCKDSHRRLMNSNIELHLLQKFAKNLKESDFGNPFKLTISLGNFSGMFNLNLISTYYICTNIQKYYSKKNNLNICEIGSGWGQCCEILNQYNKKLNFLNSYTSIDLEETLILSYLNACFNYNNDIKLINDNEFKKFNFCTPENIQYIFKKGKYFDIFINWYSFQEMTKKNVKGYIELIKKTLKPGGLFLSSNSWGEKYEIKQFSDLLLHNFEIVNIFKDGRSPAGNQQLVVVCKNVKNNKKVDIDKLNKNALLLKNTDTLTTEQFLKNIYS